MIWEEDEEEALSTGEDQLGTHHGLGIKMLTSSITSVKRKLVEVTCSDQDPDEAIEAV